MWRSLSVALSFILQSVSVLVLPTSKSNSICDMQCNIDSKLGPKLSKGASIVHTSSSVPRWSDYKAPDPGTVVNVATEGDVQITVCIFCTSSSLLSMTNTEGSQVQFCIAENISFLAQNGGNAWGTTFKIGKNDLVINLRGIRQITFNADKSQVNLQGGALVSEVIDAAYDNDTQVLTGNCNCIGALGAALGGGYSRLMGLYGLGVDNIISLSLVTPEGKATKVGPNDGDLWWALRGAGPNFGVVTSATMKAYPVPRARSGAWLGPLIFSEDKIEDLAQAINDLDLQPSMAIFLYFAVAPPNNKPSVIVLPFYLNGNETEGRAAFSSIFALGPVADQTAWSPYNQINAGGEVFCVKGGRKPSYPAGLANVDPATWRAVWNLYIAFLENPGTQNSSVLLEYYSLDKVASVGDASSAYPFRSSIKFHGIAIPWYTDPSLDSKAEAFGSAVRDLWRATDGLQSAQT